ncbi:hypothetical protein [Nostoc sp. CHAB 5715]|uniref:hypothetical protein n=1 Tax=Nostoc sp. CHAB 5715 TaxID=2780400 RepID=UPI001E4FEE48|nr:hypothetical protein [Nostoc sp. CHAB 5715]MCC5622471.1 hypothetical protein [Nostoc sp. CHAB 5715]
MNPNVETLQCNVSIATAKVLYRFTLRFVPFSFLVKGIVHRQDLCKGNVFSSLQALRTRVRLLELQSRQDWDCNA